MTKDVAKDDVILRLIALNKLALEKKAAMENWDQRIKRAKLHLDAALKFLLDFDSSAGPLFDKERPPE